MNRPTQATRAAPYSLAALAAALLLMVPVLAQAQTDDTGFDQPAWTGRVQDPAAARKEAAAALAEGRRECSRQAAGRAACLKQVEDDHKAALKRLQTVPAAPAKAATRKP